MTDKKGTNNNNNNNNNNSNNNNNNNNNNYKTSTPPISSKRIELSGAPSEGVGQTHSPGVRCKVLQQ